MEKQVTFYTCSDTEVTDEVAIEGTMNILGTFLESTVWKDPKDVQCGQHTAGEVMRKFRMTIKLEQLEV